MSEPWKCPHPAGCVQRRPHHHYLAGPGVPEQIVYENEPVDDGENYTPVELPVLGPGIVTWDGRTLHVTYAPGLTAEEATVGSARVKAMLEARKRP